ncbi:MAG: hypothetical protein HRT47_12560 [Candidatus Caenarcaniphilales bacterium]|nr:hypothetical protein [Candidatus Caenarcaniphilales bacterium]
MNRVIEAKSSFFKAKYEALEEEISVNESMSHFQDADFAEESTKVTKAQIQQQTASAMYTQANAQAQFTLSLLPQKKILTILQSC